MLVRRLHENPRALGLLRLILNDIEDKKITLEEIGLKPEELDALKRQTVTAWIEGFLRDMEEEGTEETLLYDVSIIELAHTIINSDPEFDDPAGLLEKLKKLERAAYLGEVLRVLGTSGIQHPNYEMEMPAEQIALIQPLVKRWGFTLQELGISKKAYDQLITSFN